MKKAPKQIRKFIDEVLAIEAEDACSSGNLGFMARAMVLATLPHSKPDGHYFQRKSGILTLTMVANPQYGLPYGSLPRLLLAWITAEAVKRKSPVITLGKTLSSFLIKLGLASKGGVRGDITRLRKQMLSLFTTQISCIYHNPTKGHTSGENFLITRSFDLWWNPLNTKAMDDAPSSQITLARDFFDELIDRPIPINFRALNVLRRSPLQMDIYTWLTYRFSYYQPGDAISWSILKSQFGTNYKNNAAGLRKFKAKFIDALNTVLMVYSTANVQIDKKNGLRLLPSPTHIKKRQNKNIRKI